MKRPAGFDRAAQSPAEPVRGSTPPVTASRGKKTRRQDAGSDGVSRSPHSPQSRPTPTHQSGLTPPSELPRAPRNADAHGGKSSLPFDPSDTTTEPIVLAGKGVVGSIIAGGPRTKAQSQAQSQSQSFTGSAAGAQSAGVRAPDATRTPAEPSNPTTGVRAARSMLRAAGRARKRFERAEVRRFTERARRRRTSWILGLGAVVVVFGLIIGTAYSPVMALRTIEVVGTSRILATDVSQALGDQLGTPLPLIDANVVQSELAKFTLIQSYVTESRPPGTLVVRIVERVPVGVLPGPGGFDLVDAAGVTIETAKERPAGYPVIDTQGGVDSAGFHAAAAVLAVVPENIRTQLDFVTAASTDDVTLSLLGGERVVWGSPEQSEYKAVVLAALLVGHPAGSVNEYDVSSPDSAVLR